MLFELEKVFHTLNPPVKIPYFLVKLKNFTVY